MSWEEPTRALLLALGCQRLEASWEGGGDQGGFDEITLYQDDLPIDVSYTDAQKTIHRVINGQRTIDSYYVLVTPRQHRMNQLWEVLGAELSDHYGSFAGEFEASGRFVVDLENNLFAFEDSGPQSYGDEDDEDDWEVEES